MSGSGGIQTSVNTLQSPAVVGDWCDSNPRYSVDAGPFGLIAGPNGLIVGRFAWLDASIIDADGAPARANNSGYGSPAGFVHRENQALIVNYLADASMLIQAGYECTLTSAGGVWANNDGATEALFGQKAFASQTTGKVSFAAAGTVVGGGSGATASIAAETWSATLSTITGDVLNTSGGVVTGTIYPGSTVSSNGVGQVVSQLTGTSGGAGTYLLSVGEQTQASATIGGTYGLLSNGTVTGVFAVGDQLSGTGVVPGTTITVLVTSAGATGGTSVVTNNTVVNSTTIVGSTSVETSFYARSSGLPGEIVKISNQPTP